jgi:hypothetical protein
MRRTEKISHDPRMIARMMMAGITIGMLAGVLCGGIIVGVGVGMATPASMPGVARKTAFQGGAFSRPVIVDRCAWACDCNWGRSKKIRMNKPDIRIGLRFVDFT